ncbi:putative exported protein, partial [Yersinia pestis PY-91]
MYLRRLY